MDSELINQEEGNILLVKGRFKSISMSLYGLFLISFNSRKKIDNYQITVSSYSDIYDYELETPWEKFEEIIINRKWKGNFNNSTTAALMDSFKKLTEDSATMEHLFDRIYDYDYDQIDIILHDLLNRIIHDKNLVIETSIQEVTQDELLTIRNERSKTSRESEEEAEDKKNKKAVILQVKPSIAPLNGKPIYEIRIGDRIMVRITPATSRENYYIDMYNLREGNIIKLIPATVVDIKISTLKNTPIEILTELMPDIYGYFREEEKLVKLRMYDQADTDKSNKSQKNELKDGAQTDSKGSMKNIIIIAVLFVIILILLLVLIFMGW